MVKTTNGARPNKAPNFNTRLMKINKEEQLNNIFSDAYTEDEAVEKFIYLTNKNRGASTTVNHIRNCHRNGTLGTLLKRLDITAFNCA